MLDTPNEHKALASVAHVAPVEQGEHAFEPARQALARAIARVNELILGKSQQVRLAFACLLAGGHLLVEDLPGTGKTMLGRSLASVLNLSFHRVQFTSDLMPSDILGVSVFRPNLGEFELHQGPVFTNVLLADEINRASPRVQSALLEAMAEGQVSIDRQTLKLPVPFLVIATQNPVDRVGTFPLPDAQMDRFLFQITMGYPDQASEMALMLGQSRNAMLEETSGGDLSHLDLQCLRKAVGEVTVSVDLAGYVYALVKATRENEAFETGLSPRASLALVEAARALAFLDGRSFVRPEDVQEAFLPLAAHRLSLRVAGSVTDSLNGILAGVALP